MLPQPKRVGPRVRLAFPRVRDRDEVLALNRASRALHRGWVAPPTTPAQFARFMARARRPDFAGLLVRRLADDAILGAVEVSQIVLGAFRSAYLGYQLGAPYVRQGYMSEALRLVLAYGFGPLGLHRLEANVRPENAASIALVRRLGFTREGYSRRYLKVGGRWRDHERWAILAEDWRARSRRRTGGVLTVGLAILVATAGGRATRPRGPWTVAGVRATTVECGGVRPQGFIVDRSGSRATCRLPAR